MMGDFCNKAEKGETPTPDQTPTPSALRCLSKLIAAQLKTNKFDVPALKAHRDQRIVAGGRDCPGGIFYPIIKSTVLPKVSASLGDK